LMRVSDVIIWETPFDLLTIGGTCRPVLRVRQHLRAFDDHRTPARHCRQ